MLLISILTGVVVTNLGERAASVNRAIDTAGQIFFRIIGIIVKLAPIGAFGAMAFTIGEYGIQKVYDLAWLVGTFYITAILFVLVVLGHASPGWRASRSCASSPTSRTSC